MNDDDRLILVQIVKFCEIIENRIDEFSINSKLFQENAAYADMLLLPVLQIGELANALSREYVESCPEIPWHAISGFRNVIVHDYAIVDTQWAWNTIEVDIPVLKKYVRDQFER